MAYSNKKIQRITIDLDNKSKLKLFYIKTILTILNFKNIIIKKSPSKRGYHIIAWHNKGFCKKKLLKIRNICLDDKRRIELDKRTNRQINVLFDKKKVKIIKR